jgi:hypothetical protein
MKGKLYKTNNDTYILVDPTKETYDKGHLLGTSRESDVNKLFIKNCQAIENGYDLDNLADSWVFEKNGHKWSNNDGTAGDNYGSFKAGFERALELMEERYYTKDQMMMLAGYVAGMLSRNKEIPALDIKKESLDFIDSMEQKEWDVEIEMEPYHDGEFVDDGKTHIFEPKWKPLLDENGCLILKRL